MPSPKKKGGRGRPPLPPATPAPPAPQPPELMVEPESVTNESKVSAIQESTAPTNAGHATTSLSAVDAHLSLGMNADVANSALTLTESVYRLPVTPGRATSLSFSGANVGAPMSAGVITSLVSAASGPVTPRRQSDAMLPPRTPLLVPSTPVRASTPIMAHPRAASPMSRASSPAFIPQTPSAVDAVSVDLPMSPPLIPGVAAPVEDIAGEPAAPATESSLHLQDETTAAAIAASVIAAVVAPPLPFSPPTSGASITQAPILFAATAQLPFSPPAAETLCPADAVVALSSVVTNTVLLAAEPAHSPSLPAPRSGREGSRTASFASPTANTGSPAVPPAVVAAAEAAREASRVVARIVGTKSHRSGLSTYTVYLVQVHAPTEAKATAAGRAAAALQAGISDLPRRYTAFEHLFAAVLQALAADMTPAGGRWRRVLSEFSFPVKVMFASWRSDVVLDRMVKLSAALELITQAATEVAAVDNHLAAFLTSH